MASTFDRSESTKSPVGATELLRSDAGDVQGTTVRMERSGADHVTAERVTMDRSGAKNLEARSAQLDRSGVLRLKADHAVVHQGSIGIASAKEARIVRSKVLVLRSDTTHMEPGARVLLQIGGRRSAAGSMTDAAAATSVTRMGVTIAAAVVLARLILGFVRGRSRR
jgi:hypothetical protein